MKFAGDGVKTKWKVIRSENRSLPDYICIKPQEGTNWMKLKFILESSRSDYAVWQGIIFYLR